MKRLSGFIAVALAALFLVVNVIPVQAAEEQRAGSGLSITPRKNYKIESGKSVKDTLKITNLSGDDRLIVTMKMVDFTFMNDTGTPKLNLDQNVSPTTWSLRQFVTLPDRVEIDKGQTKNVEYSLKIPKEIGAGSYYGAIVYSATSPDGGQVNLSASGVTLAFVSVPGDVKQNLSLTKFGAYNEESNEQKNGFVFIATDKEPSRMAYKLKNSGNVFESPNGTITLNYMFGGKPRTLNANPNSSLALIGQERIFSACIELAEEQVDFGGTRTSVNTCKSPGLWPGRYTAKLNVFYGENGNQTKEISANASFWYLPWWFLVALLVFLVLLSGAIYGVVSKVRNTLYGGKQSFRGSKKLKVRGRRR